jgi:hypothetical protein
VQEFKIPLQKKIKISCKVSLFSPTNAQTKNKEGSMSDKLLLKSLPAL